ncbi:MAG: hypothetical protein OEV91_10860 [Desulfobulbaceae bacterium]|nr:hypothetical protein [Desulfobulbaceae bacterium]
MRSSLPLSEVMLVEEINSPADSGEASVEMPYLLGERPDLIAKGCQLRTGRQ